MALVATFGGLNQNRQEPLQQAVGGQIANAAEPIWLNAAEHA